MSRQHIQPDCCSHLVLLCVLDDSVGVGTLPLIPSALGPQVFCAGGGAFGGGGFFLGLRRTGHRISVSLKAIDYRGSTDRQ